jgi:hypothetical protein
MLGYVQDGLLRLLSPRRVPASMYTVELPAGVQVRWNRWLLELNCSLVGVDAAAGCASRTILLHPSLEGVSPSYVDGILRHELVHVEQFRRWGVLGTYLRYLWQLSRFGYADNALEREARGDEC